MYVCILGVCYLYVCTPSLYISYYQRMFLVFMCVSLVWICAWECLCLLFIYMLVVFIGLLCEFYRYVHVTGMYVCLICMCAWYEGYFYQEEMFLICLCVCTNVSSARNRLSWYMCVCLLCMCDDMCVLFTRKGWVCL